MMSSVTELTSLRWLKFHSSCIFPSGSVLGFLSRKRKAPEEAFPWLFFFFFAVFSFGAKGSIYLTFSRYLKRLASKRTTMSDSCGSCERTVMSSCFVTGPSSSFPCT